MPSSVPGAASRIVARTASSEDWMSSGKDAMYSSTVANFATVPPRDERILAVRAPRAAIISGPHPLRTTLDDARAQRPRARAHRDDRDQPRPRIDRRHRREAAGDVAHRRLPAGRGRSRAVHARSRGRHRAGPPAGRDRRHPAHVRRGLALLAAGPRRGALDRHPRGHRPHRRRKHPWDGGRACWAGTWVRRSSSGCRSPWPARSSSSGR